MEHVRLSIYGKYNISDNHLIDLLNQNPDKDFEELIVDVSIRKLYEENEQFVITVINRTKCLVCKDYDDALFINDLVNQGLIRSRAINLEDDLQMRDRSYIDFSVFSHSRLKVPNHYYMWGVKNIDCSRNLTINQKVIDEVHRISSMLASCSEGLTDVEKILLVVSYIQENCEYISTRVDELGRTGEQFELLNSRNDTRSVFARLFDPTFGGAVGTTAAEALFEKYACCTGFSELLELFLNNPHMGIWAEQVSGGSHPPHAWNVVLLDGRYYQIDVTRSITYSPYRLRDNLKTAAFNPEYILVGTDFLEKEKHEVRHSSLKRTNEESREDYNRDIIALSVERLKSMGLIPQEYRNDSLYERKLR